MNVWKARDRATGITHNVHTEIGGRHDYGNKRRASSARLACAGYWDPGIRVDWDHWVEMPPQAIITCLTCAAATGSRR